MGLFGQNMKKLKILKLSRDSRYLQKLALKLLAIPCNPLGYWEASEEELTALAFEKHPSALSISTRCFPSKNDGLLETCFGPHEHLKGSPCTSPSLKLHEDEGWFGGTLAEHQECSEANVPTTL